MTSIKTIYLVRRNPGLSYEEFVERWRQHAKLSASFPEVLKRFDAVVQCRRVLDEVDESLGLTQEFDGANLLGLTSLLEAVDVYQQEGIETLQEDELRVFDNYVRESAVTGVEHVLLDGERSRFVLLELVRRHPGEGLDDFLLDWTGRHGRALTAAPAFQEHVRRHVHNQVVLPPPDGWDYDGVAELWFDDLDAATGYLRWARSDAGRGADRKPALATLLELSHVWIRRA